MNSVKDPVFPTRTDWLFLASGLLVLLVFCLGERGLNEPDEGRYANIARAMAVSGDWWEPRMSGYGHYDKPPLIYWTTAASLRIFGMNEWAARVPSMLGAVCTLTGLGWAAYRLRGPRVAWWAVLIGGTSVQFFVLARILSPDMLLTGWCTLAVAAWTECRHRGGTWPWWGVSLIFWTLAWWTKATPALIPLAGLFVGLLATGDTAGRKALRVWLLLPSILVLGAIWFLSMMSHYPELKQFFFGRELAGRMAGRVDGRHGSKLYYLPVSLVAWLPWWPWAAWSLWKTRKGLAGQKWYAALRLEWWIVTVGLIIFSLASSKLPTYTLTLAPWAALGFAGLICRSPDAPGDARVPRTELAVAGCFALIVSVGAFVFPRYETALGVNSSLRQVCSFLRTRNVARVDADQYWPGMEFYLGEATVRYVASNKHQRERTTDGGLAPARFIPPDDWPALNNFPAPMAGEFWLVRFRKRKHSPFDAAIAASGLRPAKTFGQFALFRAARSADGSLVVLSPDL